MPRSAHVHPSLLAAPALLLAACGTLGSKAPVADAVLVARSGSAVTGSIVLRETARGLALRGEVRGLQPNAEHGFHIHEKGDCSAPDAMSAGGHFNPGDAPHGRRGEGPHHAGDIPNLRADARGVARVDQLLEDVTLSPGPRSVAGRSLIVHRDPDDYRSQPTGNSGPRIGCAVIVLR
jgi:Cu-Zn family superoxide dismutase